MNTKKMTAFIVGAMLIATVLVMAVSAAGMDRDKYLDMPRMVYEFDAVDGTGIYINDYSPVIDPIDPGTEPTPLCVERVPTVRIYGEVDAIYPTQSYKGAYDFIYQDPVDAFDPGVIGKDSLTFNPAYMYNAASVDGDNPLEEDMKVFFRIFYEPEYGHAIDDLMVNTIDDFQRRTLTMQEGAIVTETTFMLVKDNKGHGHSGVPILGAVDSTKFTMPVNSNNSNDDTPGMTVNEVVDLLDAEGDGLLGAGERTDGAIEVGIEHVGVGPNVPVRFMDHEVEFTGSTGGFAYFDIKYLGNMGEEASADTQIAVPLYNKNVYVERYNTGQSETNPAYRWFISVGDVNCGQWCTFTVGRHLAAGETFYVDGVRYDMPAIYVTDDDKFKYITIQSPLPKCTHDKCDMWIESGYDSNQVDYSHTSNQWLARLLPNVSVWMLPPFNAGHTMIDDIDLAKFNDGDWEICTEAGDIIKGITPALNFFYIQEADEERFDSSLAERHHIRKDGVQIWNWWSIYTKPYQYTELVLPDDEDPTVDEYVAYPHNVDGNEYLITTSFIAPNSEMQERDLLSKLNYEAHDIVDRAATIANANDFASRDAYSGMPRMVFEYDAVQTEDLFVNEDRGMDDEPSVRVYGEAGAIYPTQSFTGADDFIYPGHVDPFDPGIIAKDSVTFNPAYIDHYYQYGRKIGGQEIQYYSDEHEYGIDGEEKVFIRAFYEPGYAHAKDSKMPGIANVNMPLGALVTETTYMLTMDNDNSGHSGLPIAARAKLDVEGRAYTKFILPTISTDPDMPGIETADLVDLAYASGVGTDQLTDGEIDVQLTKIALKPGVSIDFMDHRYTFLDITQQGEISIKIEYLGNMHGYEAMQAKYSSLDEDQKYWVTRSNNIEHSTTPQRRPYFTVTDRYYRGDDWEDRYIVMVVGRRLVAGETFYVDGVRYDMPAIYVTGDDKFKYITLQSPLPKCEGPMWHSNGEDNLKDPSHVSSQWLANIVQTPSEYPDDITDIWVLPPFNHDHLMIDDIGIDKDWNCGDKDNVSVDDVAGNILGMVDPLGFYYIAEEAEPRFDSSLAERLNSGGSTEIWNWWSIFTKPYQYTELVLPNQETIGMADGNEYLITTSFIAPNCEGAVRDMDNKPFCKPYDTHDIIDRASTLTDEGVVVICGDVTDDGNVNMGDVIMLFDHVTYSSPSVDASVADVTGDGNVNMGDVIMLFDHVTYGAPSLNCP